jgi:hypothetical protein
MEIRPKSGPEFYEAEMSDAELRSRLGLPDGYTIIRWHQDWDTKKVTFTLTKED